MRRLRLAVVGYGKLGRACATALQGGSDLQLAGVVVRGGVAAIPGVPQRTPLVEHVRMLENVDAALVCVPAEQVLPVARELLQQRMPIVECAAFEGRALQAHYEALTVAARHHHVAAVLGAGWDPGAFPLMRRLFDVLIPHGRSEMDSHPGLALHHSTMPPIPGVKAALTCERRGSDGRPQRYVYVQLERDAAFGQVEQLIVADPLYAGTDSFVFAVPDVGALQPPSTGILLKRCEARTPGTHQSLLLEARFDTARFAAEVMLDAARALPWLKPGAQRYRLALDPADAAL